jgi:hypothetical protein
LRRFRLREQTGEGAAHLPSRSSLLSTQGNFDNVRMDGTAPDSGVPEPAAFLLTGPALLGLAAWKRRRPFAAGRAS